MEGMSEGHWDIWAGKIVDRYGKALSDKHFPKCVLLKVSEHHVKNAVWSDRFWESWVIKLFWFLQEFSRFGERVRESQVE